MGHVASRSSQALGLGITLAAACAPLVIDLHAALGLTSEPFRDAPYWSQAFLPLIGVGSVIVRWLQTRDLPRMLTALPFVALAIANTLMWTKIVAFDPCYGSPDACADIGGAFLIAVGLFLCSVGMPLTVLGGWLLGNEFARRDGVADLG